MTFRRGLFSKYVTLIVALVSFVLVASSAVGLYFSSKENVAQLETLQHEKALAAATRIELYIQDIEHQMSWTTLPPVGAQGALREQRRYEYLKLLRQARAISELAWLDKDGRQQLLVSRVRLDESGGGADLSGAPYFKPGLEGVYYGPVYFRKETEPYMTIARPAGGPAGGVIAAEVNLKFVWEAITQINAGANSVAYVVNSDGILIAHPDISLVLKKTSLAALPQVSAVRRGLPDASTPVTARDPRGDKVLSSHATIPTLDWHVFVEAPLDEALAPLYASIYRTGYLLLAGLVLAVLASLFLARRMVRPIRALQASTAKLGAGQLGERIEVSTGDELEALARQFNLMAGQLAESYADLERKIEERTRDLEIANKHKSEFLTNMSHELRTPLNAIIGFSEVLHDKMFGDLNEEQLDCINDIRESGEHLLSLINDILDISKVEAGRMELVLGEFDLPEAIANTLAVMKERAVRQRIRLAIDVDPSLGTVRADERKVKQILLNLLSNALKFTPDGGSVSVSARRVEGGVEIAVEDTGVGIATEDREAVFEEFRQVGKDHKRKAEGTGLGLALTRKFVELHGGHVRLETEVGHGSTFTVFIPSVVPAMEELHGE